MDIRQWRDALKAAWQRVSYASELSDWLRRDIGLTADEVPAGHFKFLRVWSVKFLHPRGRTRDC
ncbi:hypothetical protein ABIF69_007490 [Bradyrhizobium japonicum]